MFRRRSDAQFVRDESRLRRFLPFISPRRNEALVYFEQEVVVDAALALLKDRNVNVPRERRATLFHLVIRALARVFHERPNLNRFTAGGRLWQRNGVWISFSAKRELEDGSPLLTVKRQFPADESFEDLVDGVLEGLGSARAGKRTRSDREMDFALRLPPTLIRLGAWALRKADHWGLLPQGMIRDDPLFATAFVANLGSIGLDAAYHHLWEYGNCGVFATMGRVRRNADGQRTVTFKFTFDERVEDGLYAANSLELIRSWLEEPSQLL